MKSIKKSNMICLSALLSVFSATPVFSQDIAGPVSNSDFYVLQVPIERIYSISEGYLIEYRKSGFGTNTVLLPKDWFAWKTGGTAVMKGEVVNIANKKVSPYLTVYYKNGKIDHVKIFTREAGHKTWAGSLPSNVNFNNIDNMEDIIITR